MFCWLFHYFLSELDCKMILATAIIDIKCSTSIGDILSRYYETETQKSFKREWLKHKKSLEHAVLVTLKESYGEMAMNIYVKQDTNPRIITKGYYLSDNVVDVLFFGMVVRDMPQLIMPEMSLSPASNLLQIEAGVSKIFIDTHYYAARNESSVVYSGAEQAQGKHSPFSLQQVHPFGAVTIIAEDCFLNGRAIITLAGQSLNIGHSTFHISDCKFTVEISSSDFSTPPVIAPYFPKGPGMQIERLLSMPLLSELLPKLQAAMYSFVNTSATFGTELPNFRYNQQKLFKHTADYMSDLCVKLNNLTLTENRGSTKLNKFDMRIESVTDEVRSSVYVALDDLTLYGLDTAYAARTGGSFEAPQLSIADAIRFSSMQIRGRASYENGSQTGTRDFAAELTDVTVDVIINIDKLGSKSVHKFEVVGWRTLDFSILPWEVIGKIRVWYESLVTGYIINEVPARIIEHLSSALVSADNEGDGEDSHTNNKNENEANEEKLYDEEINENNDDNNKQGSSSNNARDEDDNDNNAITANDNNDDIIENSTIDNDNDGKVESPAESTDAFDNIESKTEGSDVLDNGESVTEGSDVPDNDESIAESSEVTDNVESFTEGSDAPDNVETITDSSGALDNVESDTKVAYGHDNIEILNKDEFFSDFDFELLPDGNKTFFYIDGEKIEADSANTPIGRTGKSESRSSQLKGQQFVHINNSYNNSAGNRQKSIMTTSKRNKPHSNIVKLTFRKNPRVANTNMHSIKKPMLVKKRVQAPRAQVSQVHGMHMSDNEIH